MTSIEIRLPKSQIILTDARSHVLTLCGINFIQIGLSIVGLSLNAPGTNLIHKYKGVSTIRVFHIPTYDRVGFVCTLYTFCACKIPYCCDEARNIFVLYTTMTMWLSFLVVDLVNIDMENQVIAKSIDIFLSAATILAGVFRPKVYFVLESVSA